MIDVDFRKELNKILESDNVGDQDLIKFILEYSLVEYPMSLMIWFHKVILDWNLFSD